MASMVIGEGPSNWIVREHPRERLHHIASRSERDEHTLEGECLSVCLPSAMSQRARNAQGRMKSPIAR